MLISLIMKPILCSAVDAVPDGWLGLDIAEKTIKEFSTVIENSKQFSGTDQWVYLRWRNFQREQLQ
jgi:hypothetical protein